jgi:nicotinate phosphoribosyltransferase
MASPWVGDENSCLFTDLYELTMMQAYYAEGMTARAAFDLFVRKLPPRRNHLIACGLEQVLHYLETLRFSRRHIEYLGSLQRFSTKFLETLADFRFTGDVFAMPEGTVAFANEPLLEVVAPIAEAQLVETFVLNQIHVATMAASKATRIVAAAQGRPVMDYGLRRMHGADAGLKAARAFYIVGIEATSNVLAGEMYGIPVSGTMAHSYIQAHETEMKAFREFLQRTPAATLLVDTYDTIEGVRNVILLAQEPGVESRGISIRLDSGDMVALSKQARRLLNEAGLPEIKIIASSGLDEDAIAELIGSGAPIDGFGVGTHMGVSADEPFLDCVYKLVEYAGRPRTKRSPGKVLLPGRKQVFRQMEGGIAVRDIVGRHDEQIPGQPLLEPVMSGGRRLKLSPPVASIRQYCTQQVHSLPQPLLQLTPEAYPVVLSDGIRELSETT